MKPQSFSTMCTFPCIQELVGLILSLSIYHPEAHLYIVSDKPSKEYIENSLTPKHRLCLHWSVVLDKYTKLNRRQMESKGLWLGFMMEKTTAIDFALDNHSDTLFLDSDQLVVSVIDGIDNTKQLGVSPHFMVKSTTDRYGYYNAGILWTNTKEVTKRWRELGPSSRYYDQACVENLAKEFTHFEFGQEYNVQSYRFTQGIHPSHKYLNMFIPDPQNNQILFSDGKTRKPVRTFHAHFTPTDNMARVNTIIHRMLLDAKMAGPLAIAERMLMKYWVLRIPKQPTTEPKYRHSNDSFRMLPEIWSTIHKDVSF